MPDLTLYEVAKTANEPRKTFLENICSVQRFFEVLPFVQGSPFGIWSQNNFVTFVCLVNEDREWFNTADAKESMARKQASIGRLYAKHLIQGTGINDGFQGLGELVRTYKIIDAKEKELSFELFDELLAKVTSAKGVVDYLMLHNKTWNTFLHLLRRKHDVERAASADGSVSPDECVQLPSGAVLACYRGVPLFRNDWVPETEIFAGTLDDGSHTRGLVGSMPEETFGMFPERKIGWRCGLTNFNSDGLALLKNFKHTK